MTMTDETRAMKVITIDSRPVAYFALPDEDFGDVATMMCAMTVKGEPLWPQNAQMRLEEPSPEQSEAWEREGKPSLDFLVACDDDASTRTH
jgi:hypothetical protein